MAAMATSVACGDPVGPRSGAPVTAYSPASSKGPCNSQRRSHLILVPCAPIQKGNIKVKIEVKSDAEIYLSVSWVTLL